MSVGDYLLSNSDGVWTLIRWGNVKATKRFDNKIAAMIYALSAAIKYVRKLKVVEVGESETRVEMFNWSNDRYLNFRHAVITLSFYLLDQTEIFDRYEDEVLEAQ